MLNNCLSILKTYFYKNHNWILFLKYFLPNPPQMMQINFRFLCLRKLDSKGVEIVGLAQAMY